MIAKLRLLTLSATLLAGTAAAHAALLVYPSGGNVIFSGADYEYYDDQVRPGTESFSGAFFGFPFLGLTPSIDTNGNINFSNNTSPGGTLGESDRSRIAPFWTNLVVTPDASIVETLGSTFYAVTWLNMSDFDVFARTSTFQAVFFFDESTLGGHTFQANDIVFAYGPISELSETTTVSVGLEFYYENIENPEAGPITNTAFFEMGVIDSADELPTAPGEYILFRPDAFGGYDVSVTSAVPEPSAYAALAGAFALSGALLRRRRRTT